MLKKSLSNLFLLFTLVLQSQIQSPKEYLGYSLGTNFSRHHQVVDYFKHLETGSEALQLQSYGKTNEGRLLQLVFISSPENLKNLESIRKTHLQNSGIEVKSPPDEVLMAICYKPLGELSEVVRFYVKDDGSLVFLSKSAKLKLV